MEVSMPIARSSQIFLNETSYYHCYGRCVRRAFLCGWDHEKNIDYSHRKIWVQKRLALLANTFAIDVLAFAVMSNHYHLVLNVNQNTAKAWSDKQVIQRWHQIYAGEDVTHRFLEGEALEKFEIQLVKQFAKKWRKRLMDISWFMRCLNEFIARKANQEDHCTGRFWEGRFKCQALLDVEAVLSCMVYVDLNPVRAGIAKNLASSDFTSVQQRMATLKNTKLTYPKVKLESIEKHIPFLTPKAYIELTDWTGRYKKSGDKASIPANAPPVFSQLKCDELQFLKQATQFESTFARLAGSIESLKNFCINQSIAWVHGAGTKLAPS